MTNASRHLQSQAQDRRFQFSVLWLRRRCSGQRLNGCRIGRNFRRAEDAFTPTRQPKGHEMSLILIIVVLLLLFGGGGFYGYRSGYYGGRGFGGIIGLLVLLLILYLIFGGGYRGAY